MKVRTAFAPYLHVTAENAENIAITGEGIIDGSGDKWRPIKKFKMTEKQWDALFTISPYVLETKRNSDLDAHRVDFKRKSPQHSGKHRGKHWPPRTLLRFLPPGDDQSAPLQNVLLQGVTFMNSPAWNIHPYFCENLYGGAYTGPKSLLCPER